MFGGRGVAVPAVSSMKSWTVAIASRALPRRSAPIVVDGSELIPAPHSDPARWPGEDDDVVRQLEQAVQAVVEALGAVPRLDREVGPRDRADEQRVAGEETAVREEAAVLGPVAGSVDAAHGDGARGDQVTVGERVVRVLRLGHAVHRDGHLVLERQPAVAGDVVGVRVRLEHADDAHTVPLGLVEVLLDRVGRVDQDRLARSLVADEVGGAAEVLVDELAKQHSEM